MRNKLPAFEYYEAHSLEEAVMMLHRADVLARPLAGGTDILVAMRMKGARPSSVVNLKTIPGLDSICEGSSGYHIGPLTCMDSVHRHFRGVPGCEALAQSAGAVGSWQVRCRATIGGNLCNGAPSADTAPALLVLGAKVTLAGPSERHDSLSTQCVDLDQFFRGPGLTAASEGRILTDIFIPCPSQRLKTVYLKHSPRRSMDIAVVGVCAGIEIDEAGQVTLARIALGAVAPTPFRALEAGACIVGKQLDAAVCAEAGRMAGAASRPISDVRASAAYRREMVEVLVARALQSLAGQEEVHSHDK